MPIVVPFRYIRGARFRAATSAAACLLLGLPFASCGTSETPASDSRDPSAEASAAGAIESPLDTDSPQAPDPAPAERPPAGTFQIANRPWTGDFDGMVERRVIRALVVPSKTHYFVEEGRQRGIAYEALQAFEDEVNRKLGRGDVKVHVIFVPTALDDLVPALVEGRGDVAAAGLTITPGRRERVDFTKPTATGVSEIAVTGPRSPAIVTLDDLAGKEVFVRPSTSFWEHLEDLNRRFAAEGKPAVILKAAPEELENEDLLEMLNAGLFGITVVDDFIGELWAKVLPEIRLHPEIAVASGGEIGWMIRQGSPKLKAELDDFIDDHGKGTAFGNTIIKRYVGSTQFVKSATSDEDLARFQNLVELFRRYSARYDIDYLLMIAQGYQESRLDHSVRSPVGAIGVMQIMPATGEDLEVGDITQLDPNVHGGVKYMRWMIDNYFRDAPMTDLDKALFAFASYNCGPGRMRQLRREAEARGLDPDVWFNNVELVAADKIGAETVTYVSNIFKYAVAYKLVVEDQAKRRAAREGVAPSP